MKWFLVVCACLLCSARLVRGDAATDLYNSGIEQLNNNQDEAAAETFDKIITGYPTSTFIDDVHIRAGYAYLYAGKYKEAIARLAKEAAPNAKPEYRGTALYFTSLAQFSAGQQSSDKSSFNQAVSTLTALLTFVASNPSDDNKRLGEQALYYRALSEIELQSYDASEKDLLLILQQYPASLSRPDYYLRLGSVYTVQTSDAVTAKKPAEEIHEVATRAIDAFDHVSRDPNALVQANDANLSKGEVLFLLAQAGGNTADYQKALDAFRLVRRKADMIELQEKRISDLITASQQQLQAAAQQSAVNSLASDSSLLISREKSRLAELQSGPDPVIQALIRIAECYVSMKQPDEARTVLHRLIAHAQLTPDQQQEVDFQILYSYVLGGQTDEADKALTDYLSKHASDTHADSISYQIAASLMLRKDFAGALKQAERSMHDFPHGKYADPAAALKADALRSLNRIDDANKFVDDFLKQNPTSPVANQMLLTRAEGEVSSKDFKDALADFQRVRDNAAAGPEIQAGADAGYIQTLQATGQPDQVIAEAQSFATKFPTSKQLPSVMVFQGMAMDQKHDPGAAAELQNVAKTYPKDDVAPFALFYVVTLYEHTNNLPGMIQAAKDLAASYPEAYPMLAQTAETVSAVLVKAKRFEDAIALYQPLADASKPDIAAAANNKIASIWLVAAKASGYSQLATRPEADKRLGLGEQAYLATLQKFPDELEAVGNAFDGLTAAAKQRRTWGLLKDADLEGYLTKICTPLTTPEMQSRVEMAKASLVFIEKDGAKQYPQALDRFRKAATPGLALTRQETNAYGELLLAAKDYPSAQKVYQDLLDHAAETDQVAIGDAYYGLGATALAQGQLAPAKGYFTKLQALPGGGLWQAHILDAQFGIALDDEQSSAPADTSEAQQIYVGLMQSQQAGVALQAKAMLGYGRLLEKAGAAVKATGPASDEFAVHYYQEPHTLFGPAVAEQSAEGLFDAGQAYEKAGDPTDKTNAKKQYDDLIKTYSTLAPDWTAKAKAASANLGP